MTRNKSAALKKLVSIGKRVRPLKNQFFNGITALCLSAFDLTSGKEHKEIARNGRSAAPDQPAQPEETG
jgi:hypothetical protein